MLSSQQAILLVEDNDDDAELTRRAFDNAHVRNPMVRVRDGVEALDYLFARGTHAGRDPRDLPVLVLLDLNLPQLTGLEVLRAIRTDGAVRHLPVVVLTSSREERDRLLAYEQYVNSYVQKPVQYESFVAVAKDLGLYWLLLNVPPPPLG